MCSMGLIDFCVLEFSRETMVIVVCYVVVFVLAFIGNMTMLLILFRFVHIFYYSSIIRSSNKF
jgi:hypothetical protein